MPCHSCSCRSISNIQRRQTGVVGRVLQVVCGAQRLIHDVDQTAEILKVLGPVSIFNRDGRAPDSRLGVATHAVGAEQVPGVADSPLHARSARPVGEPCIHLPEVVVQTLPNGHPRIVVGGRFQQPQLDLITGRIGFGPEEVDSPGSQDAVDF